MIYAVRLSATAAQDVTDAALRLAELAADPNAAQEWSDSLYAYIGRLASTPRVYAVVSRETRLFGREMRQALFRRTAASVAYRVLFHVAEDGVDGPVVTVVHIRHSGRKPITQAEVRQILNNP